MICKACPPKHVNLVLCGLCELGQHMNSPVGVNRPLQHSWASLQLKAVITALSDCHLWSIHGRPEAWCSPSCLVSLLGSKYVFCLAPHELSVVRVPSVWNKRNYHTQFKFETVCFPIWIFFFNFPRTSTHLPFILQRVALRKLEGYYMGTGSQWRG